MPDLVGPEYFSEEMNLRMLPRDCPIHEPTAKMMRVVAINSTNPISRSVLKSGDNQKIQLVAASRTRKSHACRRPVSGKDSSSRRARLGSFSWHQYSARRTGKGLAQPQTGGAELVEFEAQLQRRRQRIGAPAGDEREDQGWELADTAEEFFYFHTPAFCRRR